MSNDEPPLNPFYYQTWVDSNGVKRIFCADGLWRVRDDCSADGILLADLQANESELTTLRARVRELEARIDVLERIKYGFIKANSEIEQALGRALRYPRFCDDQKNFPGSTDADGVCVGDHVAESLADEAANRIRELEGAMPSVKYLRWIKERLIMHGYSIHAMDFDSQIDRIESVMKKPKEN